MCLGNLFPACFQSMLGKLGGDMGSFDFFGGGVFYFFYFANIDIPEMKKGHKYVTIVCLFAH